jgi:hypothetical protein
MNEHPAEKRVFKALPPMRPKSRSVAATVDVRLPPIRWTPDLIDQVASLLADALVRDLQQHPPETPRRAS